LNERPPSPREGGSAIPANDVPAARDDAAADFAPSVPDSRYAIAGDADGSEAAWHEAEPFPWPPREGESALGAAGRTWRDVMFSPASFFRRMPAAAPLGAALVYFLALTVLGSGIRLFWDMVALAALPRPAADSTWALFLPTSARDALLSFFFAPLIMLGVLFVGGAITHGLLKLMGGAGGRYRTTLRVFAFGQSPALLSIVPFAGAFAAMVWSLIISVIGLREAHRTTTLKAALSILLPALAAGFFLLLMMLVLAVMGAALLT
jgi:hypothetical protein